MMNDADREALYKACRRVDLEAYLEATFDRIIPSGSSELRVDCFAPKGCAGSDAKGHLWVNKDKKAWICYKCGYGDPSQQKGTGWLPRFMADAERVPIRVIIERLLQTYDVVPEEDLGLLLEQLFDPDYEDEEEVTIPKMRMPKQFHEMAWSRGHLAQKFLIYAKKRGFDTALQEEHAMQYCVTKIPTLPEKYQSTFVSRIIWPIFDKTGALRSAVARDILNKGNRPKWVNWPDTEPSNYLWPMGFFRNGDWHYLTLPKDRPLVLTEGIINAYAAEKLGQLPARACFGKKISEAQIDLMQREGVKRVVLAWDFDAKAKILQTAQRLSSMFEVYVFPYTHPEWALNLDFGDALDPKSPLHCEVYHEMERVIPYGSPEFCRWANETQIEKDPLDG